MPNQQLDRTAVARRCGIEPKSVDTYRRRGSIPQPDGFVGRSPWWWSETIDHWQGERRKHNRTAAQASA